VIRKENSVSFTGRRGHSARPLGLAAATGGRLIVTVTGEVASELVDRSGHSTQGHPDTVEEVRWILREHAG